jgi:membrane-associated protein
LDIIFNFFRDLADPNVGLQGIITGWINNLGSFWAYAPLFVIIFAETGLVVTPFLPGDSLLFAAGTFAVPGLGLNLWALLLICYVAAIAGDTCNYWIGDKLGHAIIASGKVKALTPERIEKTHQFLAKWGALGIFLARFFPFIRTFAPFLAGVGEMQYRKFLIFNVLGGVTWVSLFTLLGYFFGNIPFVQDNFELVVVAMVLISAVPAAIGVIKPRLDKRKQKRAAANSDAGGE